MVVTISVEPRPYTKAGVNWGAVRERRQKFIERRLRAPCFSLSRGRNLCFMLPLMTFLHFNSILSQSPCFNSALRRAHRFSFFKEDLLCILALKRNLYFCSLPKRDTYISSNLMGATRIRSPQEGSCFSYYLKRLLLQPTARKSSLFQLAARKSFLF